MKWLISLVVGVMITTDSLAQVQTIVMWERNYQRTSFRELVQMALDVTNDEYGEAMLSPSPELEQGRAFALLKADTDIDILIAGFDREQARHNRVIYYPVDRGLLGFRVCLIRAGAKDYADIHQLSDFKQQRQRIGVGSHWPDKDIMEAQNIRLVHSPIYDDLFRMLHAERFDCFPRSLNEIDGELRQYAHLNLVAEPYIAFVYPFADFIYLRPGAEALVQRMEQGLAMLRESGAFQAWFDKHYRDVMYQYQFFNRKLLILPNANLNEKARQAINQYGIASFSSTR